MTAKRIDRKSLVLVFAALVPLVLVSAYFALRSIELPEHAEDGLAIDRRFQSMVVGGVERPISELETGPRVAAFENRKQSRQISRANGGDGEFDPVGISPTFTGKENESIKLVAEAVRTGSSPERLTPMILPHPFDQSAFESTPEKYLIGVEPGRVWQAAHPGPGVLPLRAGSPERATIKQSESVRLVVRTVAGAPATFTAFDSGSFENLAASITVMADGQGLASASFTGTSGTVGSSNILAASPLSSGQIHFIVEVLPRSK